MSDSRPEQPEGAVCLIDRSVLNNQTISDMENVGLSIFAQLCGRNRGAFVLDPPDGNTYSCLTLPSNFAELAGMDDDAAYRANITDSDSILAKFEDGNITATDAVDLIDLLVKNVYQSTANAEKSPYACDVSGLTKLDCKRQAGLLDGPIRAVTLSGVFIPAPWATGGKELTLQEARAFYTAHDFFDMKDFGLNTVQIPFPLSAFTSSSDGSVFSALEDLMELIDGAGLRAILALEDKDKDHDQFAVGAAAMYAAKTNAILAMTLPSMATEIVTAARAMADTLPLFLPANGGDLLELHASDGNIFAALDMSHSLTVGDVASSTSVDDRMKLFYHEATSCTSRSPIEYAECYKNVPIFVSSGFDLGVDDCIYQGTSAFKDYGQCDRFDETVGSGWWERHRLSFAERQLFAYERGLGWSFATWKLYGDEAGGSIGDIDSPAKLLSFKDVAAAGLFPSLDEKTPAALACLNPPEPDFLLGDDTLAPTPGPPPDCGDGWWNFTTEQCDYWIPPTPAPPAHCHHSGKALATSAFAGAAATLIVGALALKLRRKDGYRTLP